MQSVVTNKALLNSVLEILDQGEALLVKISDQDYVRKLPAAFNASIGAHYRHCLDHFQNLFNSVTIDDLNYDLRQRDTMIENDRFAALNATRRLRENFQSLGPDCIYHTLNVTCKTSYAAASSQVSPSTVGREIMYVVAHAVHHYALIGIMGGLMELEMPPGFGVAPSTVKHQAESAIVNSH
jgi:hypothetical protein